MGSPEGNNEFSGLHFDHYSKGMGKNRKYIGFNDRPFYLIGVPVIGFLMPFLFFGHSIHDPFIELAINWAISLTMSVLYWAGSRTIIIYWRKRITGVEQILRRNAFQLVTILVYSLFVEKGVMFLTLALFPGAENEAHPISGTAGTYLIIFLVVAIYEAIYLYYQWKQALLEQERVKQEHIRTQLEGLRSQVNPHFLFNSLNTLMSLVTEDQDKAVRYLQKMSSVFRHVLENRKEQLVPLEEEVKFINDYVFLQKERFQENLQVNIDIPEEALRHAIVPLSMQILFENAIKHNIISERKPLTIDVYVNEDGKLEVRNNLQRKRQEMKSTKLGLENIRDRYRFFTDQKVDITVDEEYFRVAIPMLPVGKTVSHALSHH